MDNAPETTIVETRRVWCDGSGDIRSGPNFRSASLGHPRVYMQIDEKGFVDCGYCDRRFILADGPAQERDRHEVDQGDITETGLGHDVSRVDH
ncbi:zinc-finger domain-containing protein [Croceibacterium ferulae]|uniref:zinc-finger domain-containing protein n=1 Tax=Croceibacterium ferulae TaxID=1854641 RepID=UPI000EB0983A|nr:zinc-finger domain-containing protein [Croceibacterium ferulae]